jgi:predicted TIM-barrel fold metal-dependent hydrolase
MDNLTQEVARLKALHIAGVKLHPEYQDFQVDDACWSPLYDALQNASLIVVFHAGDDPAYPGRRRVTPQGLRRVCERFPRLVMVAAHMGGNEMWDEVEADLAGQPLYFDTSAAIEALPAERFARLVRRHGVERVLFGSDSPWFSQATALRRVRELPLSSAEKEAILSGNALELLTHRRRPSD